MKILSITSLLAILIAAVACKKSDSETVQPVAYIAFFQKDSLNAYLKPSTTADTTGIRKKLSTYGSKILKECSLPQTLIQSSFYNSVSSTGIILSINDEKQVNLLKSDKRIDSLHKSINFQSF